MAAWEPNSFADQLNIATPEQVELQFSVAGIGSRFVAVLLDHLIIGGFLILEMFLFAFIGSLASGIAGVSNQAGKWFLAALIFLNFCILWGYFALFECFWHGQTPGKRVMKLRVIKDSGRQITFFESLSRNLVRFIDYLPSLYLVGVIAMLCNKRHQRLGDLAAGTLVIHERTGEQPLLVSGSGSFFAPSPSPYETMPWAPIGPSSPADSVAKLSPDDLAVIDAFFSRVLDLSLETRAQVAQRIAAQMAARMGIAQPEGNPERFLESIAHAMRGAGRSYIR
jgi:uncharacterized RDD family membrane protein YckC